MVTFLRTASLSTPAAKESYSEERLFTWQFPGPFSHDFPSLDPFIQWLNDRFTKEKKPPKVNCPRLGQAVLNVPRHASAQRIPNSMVLTGAMLRDGWVLRMWWTHAIKVSPTWCSPIQCGTARRSSPSAIPQPGLPAPGTKQ